MISCMTEDRPGGVLDALARDVRLRGYLRDGRIATMPARRSRRLLLLTEVVQVCEPGVRYPEPAVNDVLGAMFADYAALRRYLVDEGLLDRTRGEYWRIGGPVEPSQAPPSAPGWPG
jgi:hypothetical protein